MRTLMKAFVVLVLLAAVGCGNKIDGRLSELEKKPAAITLTEAKALYKEANDALWQLEHNYNPTPEQLERAKALQKRRWDEGLALIKEKVPGGGLLAGFTSIDFSKAIDWFLGTNDPALKRYVGSPVDPTSDEIPPDWK